MNRQPLFGQGEYDAVKKVLDDRWLSYYRAGDVESKGFVRKLEDAFCTYFNIKYAIAMNSATSCLHCAVKAIDGENVTTTPVTFSATAASVLMAGKNLRFGDIEPDTYCLKGTEDDIVIPVHLHGHPTDLDSFKGKVIEDASQAIGAKYKGRLVGTIGDCGIFSFNQSKPITCGEGGMLITDDDHIAYVARMMRNHGETQSNILGYNYRMTELSAAVALEQFKHLDEWNSQRIELASYLTDKLMDIEGINPPFVREDCTHVYYTYPVRVKRGRDKLQKWMGENGVFFGNGGYKPLHLIPFYQNGERYPEAERAYEEVMFTDIIRPGVNFKDMDYIAEVIRSGRTAAS